MKLKHVFVILMVCAVACPTQSFAQEQRASVPEIRPPLLTLDDAVSLALNNNRIVKSSSLEAEKFDFRVNTARSRRLPQFQFAVLGGELLRPFDFTFPAGVFGTYPGIGPVPATNSAIRTPAQFTTFTTGSLDQPVTQQYKIHLSIRALELGRQVAREDVRAQRQNIASEVRKSYFDLVAAQAGVDAAREAVKTLEEAQSLSARHEAERTLLRADALEVDARLAKGRYELSVAENGLATQREHLNQLLGRGLTTVFCVAPFPEENNQQLTLEEARQQAARNRPEVRKAQLTEKRAEVDRRLAKAEYIPDLSFSVRYLGMSNVEVLPRNVATAGFLLTWEPFDWGRRHNAVAEKSKAAEQARNGVQETESQIAVEVGMVYRKFQDASLLLKAARIAHEAAAEQFRVTKNRYKEQAALIKDLLQAQAHSAEADFQYQQALSSYWSASAELHRAMGEE